MRSDTSRRPPEKIQTLLREINYFKINIMEFKAIQQKAMENARRYGKKHNVVIDENFAVLKLYEEVGEFAQAVLIHNRKSRPEKFIEKEISKEMVAAELADIVGLCMVNAELLNIDLEKAIHSKWISKVLE